MVEEKLDQKVINNAVSAYFFLGALLLLNKDNPLINNSFVRGHAKTAAILHLLFLVVFFFLSFFSFLGNVSIFSYDILYIIQTLMILGIFGTIVYGAVRAYNGKEFQIKEIPDITKTHDLVHFSKNSVTKENDKTNIIMSYIPFFGYLLYPKFEKYATIRSVNKINLYSSIVIILFYTSGKYNLASLLVLLYITYVVFTAVTLYVQNRISVINLEKLWSFEELYIRAKAFVLYIYNYANRDNRFREYELYLKIEKASVVKQNKLMLKDLLPRKSLPFKKWILYIPFVNLVGVFFLDTRYKTHIINGLCVNIMLVLIWIIFGFNSSYSLFILFPISYGIAYQRKIDYRFPVIYDIAKVEMKAWNRAKSVVEDVNRKRKENKEVVLTVKDFKQKKEETTDAISTIKNTNTVK